MKLENLTKEQIKQAWDWTCENPNNDANKVRYDLLGAEIHFDEYNDNKPYGWCIEYIITPEILAKWGKYDICLFCQENVVVLLLGNYEQNIGHKVGQYDAWYISEGYGNNKRQYARANYVISKEWIRKLQQTFGLSDNIINDLFPYIEIYQ